MIKYAFCLGVVLTCLQCSSLKKTTIEQTLISKVLSTYADSIRTTAMSATTREKFVSSYSLLMKEGIADSLGKSAMLKKGFNGYLITNNQYTIGKHENVYFDVFELKEDTILMRLTYMYAAWSSDRNLKDYSQETVVSLKNMEALVDMKDGVLKKYSPGIILFKIVEGRIKKVNMLLNPPKQIITDLYYGGITRH